MACVLCTQQREKPLKTMKTIKITPEAHQALKIRAAQEGITLTQLIDQLAKITPTK